jgi:prepilin-type N-terminal cleavage/methylation domain-containing protein
MKNKGFTLVELIVSISLISIVIIFLFRLFADLEYSNKQRDYSRSNQQNRAIIMKRVQDDFLDYGLIGLSDENSKSNLLVVDFTFNDGKVGKLVVDSESISYTNAEGSTEKWVLEKENNYMGYNVNCVKYAITDSDSDGEFFYIRFSIPLNYKSSSQNAIDDIEFSYIGNKTKVDMNNFTSKISLGDYNNESCSK